MSIYICMIIWCYIIYMSCLCVWDYEIIRNNVGCWVEKSTVAWHFSCRTTCPLRAELRSHTAMDGLDIPSGKRLHNYGKSPFFMGKSTISIAIFNSYFDITRPGNFYNGIQRPRWNGGLLNPHWSCVPFLRTSSKNSW